MRRRIISLFLFAGSVLCAADFQDFQSARAVIGQPSFSARERGITALALSFGNGNLYVADTSGHVLTYAISRIGSAKTAGCPVCLASPEATVVQSVFEGIAAVAVNGRNIAIADEKSHRVMLWNGVSPLDQPDIVLSGFVDPTAVSLDSRRLFVADAGTHHVFIWNAWPTSGSQPPDVTLGASEGMDVPGADTIQTPSALASDGANLFVADSAAHRVLVFSPGDSPAPQIANAATLAAGPLAPGTLVTVQHATAKSSMFLNGEALPVTESNGDQLQLQIPYDLNNAMSGAFWTQTELDDGTTAISRPTALRFTSASPGIFAFGAKEPRTGLLLHSSAGVPLTPEDPAKPNELLTVWATGLGAVASEANSDGAFGTLIPVRAAINGNPVEVISAVLPAEATGVYEVRLRCPAQLPPGTSLVLVENDTKSNVVTFPVESN